MLGEVTVVASLWNCEVPEIDGLYTAHVLALDPGTILDYPQYLVLDIGCDVNDERWVVLDELAFPGVLAAAQHYCRISGDD